MAFVLCQVSVDRPVVRQDVQRTYALPSRIGYLISVVLYRCARLNFYLYVRRRGLNVASGERVYVQFSPIGLVRYRQARLGLEVSSRIRFHAVEFDNSRVRGAQFRGYLFRTKVSIFGSFGCYLHFVTFRLVGVLNVSVLGGWVVFRRTAKGANIMIGLDLDVIRASWHLIMIDCRGRF